IEVAGFADAAGAAALPDAGGASATLAATAGWAMRPRPKRDPREGGGEGSLGGSVVAGAATTATEDETGGSIGAVGDCTPAAGGAGAAAAIGGADRVERLSMEATRTTPTIATPIETSGRRILPPALRPGSTANGVADIAAWVPPSNSLRFEICV